MGIDGFMWNHQKAYSCDNVTMVTRKEWGARDPKKIVHMNTPVTVLFIHHTDMQSCHTLEHCIKDMKIIQDFHMDVRGELFPKPFSCLIRTTKANSTLYDFELLTHNYLKSAIKLNDQANSLSLHGLTDLFASNFKFHVILFTGYLVTAELGDFKLMQGPYSFISKAILINLQVYQLNMVIHNYIQINKIGFTVI